MSWLEKLMAIINHPNSKAKASRSVCARTFTISLVCTEQGTIVLYFNWSYKTHPWTCEPTRQPAFWKDGELVELAKVAEEYGLGPDVSQRFYNEIIMFVSKAPRNRSLTLLRDGTVSITEI